MLEAADKVADFARGMDAATFRADTKTVYAVVRALEIIGEAARHIPRNLRLKYPDVPWTLERDDGHARQGDPPLLWR